MYAQNHNLTGGFTMRRHPVATKPPPAFALAYIPDKEIAGLLVEPKNGLSDGVR